MQFFPVVIEGERNVVFVNPMQIVSLFDMKPGEGDRPNALMCLGNGEKVLVWGSVAEILELGMANRKEWFQQYVRPAQEAGPRTVQEPPKPKLVT